MSQLIFYGAGENASVCFSYWYALGNKPLCFADKNIELHYTLFKASLCADLEILPLFEAISRFPDYELMLTQVRSSIDEVRKYLLELGIPNDRITLPKSSKSLPPPNCSVGKNTYSGGYVSDMNSSIGSFCSIAANVNIGVTCHPTNWLSTSVFSIHEKI